MLVVASILICTTLLAQSSLQEGIALVEQKSFDKAKKVFESLVKQEKKNAEARYQLGSLLLSQFREYDDAVDNLEEAVELDGKNARYVWMLGNAYGAKARTANIFSQLSLAGKTKDAFALAVELDPNELRYRQSLMGYYIAAPGIAGGSMDKAREQADAILRISPYDGHIALGQIAARDKNISTAEQEYKKAIASDAKRFRAYHLLGYLYLGEKRIDEAIAQFQKYVEVAPEDANSYDSLGEALMIKGSLDAAIEQFRKAITVNPKFEASIFNLAQCYEKRKMYAEAVNAYSDYLAVAPEGSNAGTAKKKVKELKK